MVLSWVIRSFFLSFIIDLSWLNFNCMAIGFFTFFTLLDHTSPHPAWRAELRRSLLELRQLVLRQHAWKATQSQGHGASTCERLESSLRPLHKWLRSTHIRRHFFCKIFTCSFYKFFHAANRKENCPRLKNKKEPKNNIIYTYIYILYIPSQTYTCPTHTVYVDHYSRVESVILPCSFLILSPSFSHGVSSSTGEPPNGCKATPLWRGQRVNESSGNLIPLD